MKIKTAHLTIVALLGLPALAAAAGTIQLPRTGQTTCFGINGDVIPCAATGQDGDTRAGVAWESATPSARFTDNANGTVTDTLTGLVWSKHANAPSRALPGDPLNGCANAEADMTWPQALTFIGCLNAANHAGFNDWRLPNLNEIESMVNAENADSSVFLNANGFGLPGLPASQVQSSQYWSSTTDAQFPDSAWNVDLLRGEIINFFANKNDIAQTMGVWPVRGTSSLPARPWQTGQTTCFDAAGLTVACAATAQDGELRTGAAWPVPRFQPNVDSTFVFDKLTGLIWTQNSATPGPPACAKPVPAITWQEALDHVNCLNQNAFLGRTDWRVPNRKDLRSLLDYSRTVAPLLPAGHPFSDTTGETYWTSTTDASASTRAWGVSTFDGVVGGSDKGSSLTVWPVSGPDLVVPTLTINAANLLHNTANRTIGGTVEAGATVNVTAGATTSAATVTGTDWTFALTALATGDTPITVTATDAFNNIATQAATVTLVVPDGDVDRAGGVTLQDVLRVLRITVGIVPAVENDRIYGDVAPFTAGKPAPDGTLGIPDVIIILKKFVGILTW